MKYANEISLTYITYDELSDMCTSNAIKEKR